MEDFGYLIQVLKDYLEPLIQQYSGIIKGVSSLDLNVSLKEIQQRPSYTRTYIAVEFTVKVSEEIVTSFRTYDPKNPFNIFSKENVYNKLKEDMASLKKWVEIPFTRLPLHLPLPNWKEDKSLPPFAHRLIKLRLKVGF